MHFSENWLFCNVMFRSAMQTSLEDVWCCVWLQWKVRRTLAFSIHQLAVILGEELTVSDLVPVFDEFLKDLDEVRVGALKHLADFLRVSVPSHYILLHSHKSYDYCCTD